MREIQNNHIYNKVYALRSLPFWLAAAMLLTAACSSIGEADRLVPVSVVQVDTTATDTTATDTAGMDLFVPTPRHVLVEDFTGQNCVNCPLATELIGQLQQMYGPERIVAVGVHSGPLGVKPTANPEGLATDLGDTYYDYWHIQMQPYGVIDRSDGPLSTDWWTGKVRYDLSAYESSPVNIWPAAVLSADGRQMEVTVRLAGVEGSTSGQLQVWVTEDHITAFQKMPDGTTNAAYDHNHVLRAAANGAWGEDCTVDEGDVAVFSYSVALEPSWKPQDLAVVAFVYKPDGVVQAAKAKLQTAE